MKKIFAFAPALLLSIAFAGCSGKNASATADAAPGSADAAAAMFDAAPPAADANIGPDARPPRPDASPPQCSPEAQDCSADPTKPKCTLAGGAGGSTTVCVAETGTMAENAACTRAMGNDDCTKGFLCTSTGVASATTMRFCRKFCTADATCTTSGQRCAQADNLTPPDGICVPTCTLFDTTCGTGNDCAQLATNLDQSTMAVCRIVGTTALGATCMNSRSCVAGSICTGAAGAAVCTALCDSTHTCATGTCTAQAGLPNGGGVCM